MANASLINIGLSGVRAHQAALSTTGQNITNAAVPGYTRQRVNLETETSLGTGAGAQGVRVQGVERIYDQAAVNQIRLDSAAKARLDTLTEQLSQVDELLADQSINLNRGFEQFFAALHAAAGAPTSLAARQLVLSEAEGLVARFQGLDGRLRSQRDDLDRQVASEIARINQLAGSLGELNARLGPMSSGDAGTNALLDQRDELLRQLSELVDVKAVPDGELGMSIFLGKGHPLVVGTSVSALQWEPGQGIRISGSGSDVFSAVTVRGGSLGGLLTFREQTLDPVLDELGRLALGVAGAVNETHAQGLTLRGEFGGSLFGDINAERLQASRVIPANPAAEAASATLSVRIDDPSVLVASDYLVRFTGAAAEGYEIVRSRDGEVVSSGSATRRPLTMSFDGLTLQVGSGQVGPGAEFRIDAAGGGVAGFSVDLADPRDLALASPLAIEHGAANRGTGTLTVTSVDDVSTGPLAGDGALNPPLVVRFTSPSSYEVLDNSDPTNPQPLSPPIWGLPFVPGGAQPLLPDAGQHLLVSDGRDSGGVSGGVAHTTTLEPAANRFASETLTLHRSDPASGRTSAQGRVEIAPGTSARAIAAALEALDGVSAAARTELSITGLHDNGIGEPLAVAVNGEALILPPGSGLNDLADAINGSAALRAAGIEARSDGTTLRLTAERGDDLALHVAGDVTDGIEVTDGHGGTATLRGAGPGGGYDTVTVGGDVRLLLAEGVSLESDSAAPGGGLFSSTPAALPAALGFQARIAGRPEAGDTFAIAFNEAGNLDNHNALALAELQVRPTLGEPPASFAETFSQTVELVGIRTSQARTDAEAAASLLEQSVARREAISGVNLDEEAANLIKFEQGYNASARVVSVAREIFDVLLHAVS